MGSFVIGFLLIFIVAITTTNSQSMNSMAFLLGESGQEFVKSLGFGSVRSYLAFINLNQRVQALSNNVRTGAIGGCVNGVIGPLNIANPTITINFQNPFLFPPSLTLALTGLTTINPAAVSSFQVNPISVTNSEATVNLVDTFGNIAAAFVSYMACPSNRNPLVSTNTGTINPFMG